MREQLTRLKIDFGDCDPAGIVFYPNYFRWFDRATHDLFGSAGYSHIGLRREHGWLAWPLADVGARFRLPATFGDQIEIRSSIGEWRDKTFKVNHLVSRGADLLVEGWELRFIGEPHPEVPGRLRAVMIPAPVTTTRAGETEMFFRGKSTPGSS